MEGGLKANQIIVGICISPENNKLLEILSNTYQVVSKIKVYLANPHALWAQDKCPLLQLDITSRILGVRPLGRLN